MQTRRITIEGNRYLIFYTFDEQPASAAAASTKATEAAPPPEPRADPVAEEERRV